MQGTDDTPESWVTVCETCRRAPAGDSAAGSDGAALAALVEAAAQGVPGVRVRRHACLMGCARACNVAIQARGKIAYTLADFAPDGQAAAAIVAYAALHAQSETGRVPYRDWPAGVKGHFATRHPPLP